MDIITMPWRFLCSECGEMVFIRMITAPGVAAPHSAQGMCCNKMCARYRVEFRMPLVRVEVEKL